MPISVALMAAQWIGGYHGPAHTRPPTAQQMRKPTPERVGEQGPELVGVPRLRPVAQCPGCGASMVAWVGGGPVCAYCGSSRTEQLLGPARQAVGFITMGSTG